MPELAASDATASSNGHAPKSRIDRIADEVREELAIAQSELDEYLRGLDERKGNVTRLRKALDALTGTTVSSAPTSAPKHTSGRKPGTKWGEGKYTPVSRDNVERTMRLLDDVDGPATIDQLFDYAREHGGGIGRDTIRRALLQMRDAERVRIAGRTDRGGVLYAPMPDASS